MMKLRVSGQGMLVLLVGVSLSSCGVASDQNPHQEAAAVDNRAAEEAKIRSVDAEWVKAVARKDAQQTATYYTEGSALMAPGAPLAAGKEAIQKTWAGLMGTAGFFADVCTDKDRSVAIGRSRV